MTQLGLVTTEQSNQATKNLDLMSAQEIVTAINTEDHKVAEAVELCLPSIAEGATEIAKRLKKGGRVFIFGAGTSGRLGVMNAVGITEKYALKPGQINGVIAGGDRALRFSIENSEDNREQAIKDLMAFKPTKNDIVFGISAGGGAPYILQVLQDAQALGLYTIGYSSNANAKLKPFSHTFINPVVGPEVLTGSSRMKSGSAQEMTLIALLESAVSLARGKSIKNNLSGIIKDFKKAAPAVKKEIPRVTKAINLIADALQAGGRVFYFGAGPSGRLGVLDASECWPTFGVEHGTVNGRVEGGDAALRQLFQHTNDESAQAAKADFERTEVVGQGDKAVSIAPPGKNAKDIVIILENTPYSMAALNEAKKRGLKTIIFSTQKEDPVLPKMADAYINPKVPAVAVPLATKFVLNTLTTASMVRVGKVLGNRMVDVAVMNDKLKDRAVRIIADCCREYLGVDVVQEKAADLLAQAQAMAKKRGEDDKRHVVPVAIVMGALGCDAKQARAWLDQDKLVREVVKKHRRAATKAKTPRTVACLCAMVKNIRAKSK